MLNSKLDVTSKLFFVSRRFLRFLIYFKQKKTRFWLYQTTMRSNRKFLSTIGYAKFTFPMVGTKKGTSNKTHAAIIPSNPMKCIKFFKAT